MGYCCYKRVCLKRSENNKRKKEMKAANTEMEKEFVRTGGASPMTAGVFIDPSKKIKANPTSVERTFKTLDSKSNVYSSTPNLHVVQASASDIPNINGNSLNINNIGPVTLNNMERENTGSYFGSGNATATDDEMKQETLDNSRLNTPKGTNMIVNAASDSIENSHYSQEKRDTLGPIKMSKPVIDTTILDEADRHNSMDEQFSPELEDANKKKFDEKINGPIDNTQTLDL